MPLPEDEPELGGGLPGEPALASASGAPAQSTKKMTRGGITAVLLALLAKGKALLIGLKALPLAKLLLTGGSMAATVLLYARLGGFPFALGLVLMILIHELGHGAAMKRAGVEAGWPLFIPFFGAMIAMKGRPEHPRVEAEIAYAGPLAGTAAALACATIGLLLQSRFFLALAYTGFFLNLFNLTPFGFLDGGRIARVISRKASIVGGVIMGGLCLLSPSPQLVLIAALGLMQSFRRDNADLDRVTPEDRAAWALRYFGLCGFLALGTLLTHQLTKAHGW
ncbi:MAG TPA: site-2 protease family protein [Polyangiaceae bacterium]|jgi:Zn-dependent protease|nr:site-2 protease family protein [Polyangiaceae bacterium]